MIGTSALLRRLLLMCIAALVVAFAPVGVAAAAGSGEDATGHVVFVGEDEEGEDDGEDGAGGGEVPSGGVGTGGGGTADQGGLGSGLVLGGLGAALMALLIAGALRRRFNP